MELIIVTGMSGAGKSRVINALEDLGYFCVDNVPPLMLEKFAQLGQSSQGSAQKMAVVVDARGGEMFADFTGALDRLRQDGFPFRLLLREEVNLLIGVVIGIKKTICAFRLMFSYIRACHPLRSRDDIHVPELQSVLSCHGYDTALFAQPHFQQSIQALFRSVIGKLLIECLYGFMVFLKHICQSSDQSFLIKLFGIHIPKLVQERKEIHICPVSYGDIGIGFFQSFPFFCP